jgi:hypothetical protein
MLMRPRGKNLTVTAAGKLSKDIELGSYVKLQVKYGFFQLWSGTVDLCEQAPQIDEQCPVKKGEKKVSTEFEIPQDVPPVRHS